MNRVILAAVLLLLAGCQTLPRALQGEYDSLTAADLPRLNTGDRVRWAGVIHKTRNERSQTCLVVIGLLQGNSGRPRKNSEPQGRFEACAPRFLDPAIYQQGRAITVTGTLRRTRTELVGEYPLQVAVIAMDNHVLWQPRTDRPNETILLFDPWWPGYWFPGPVIHHHSRHHPSPAPDKPRH